MAKQAVVVKESVGLPTTPDFMKEYMGLGTERLDASSVETPRLKLMQLLSPELETHNDLKAGDFFHSIAELNMGPQVRITPIFVSQSFILWRPRETGGGILARAEDGVHWSPSASEFQVKLKSGQDVVWKTAPTVAQSGLDQWGSSFPGDTNSPPAATRMYNVVVSFPDDPDMPPAVVTLQRAAIRVARKFIGKLKITRAPSFGLIFKMSSTEDRNAAGQKFYNFAFSSDGMVEDKQVFERNLEMYKFFEKQGVRVKDLESAQDDGIGDDAPSGDKPKF